VSTSHACCGGHGSRRQLRTVRVPSRRKRQSTARTRGRQNTRTSSPHIPCLIYSGQDVVPDRRREGHEKYGDEAHQTTTTATKTNGRPSTFCDDENTKKNQCVNALMQSINSAITPPPHQDHRVQRSNAPAPRNPHATTCHHPRALS
jgi:hypothetical protein